MSDQVRGLRLLAALVFAGSAALLFGFTAEDAFITYRYAANFATLGTLVFNVGEPVLALTSPLHGLLATLLYRVTPDIVIANKVFSLLLLAAVALLLLRRYRDRPVVQLLVVALALLPPGVMLWTVGGLETPILLFLATALVVLADGERPPALGRVCAVTVVAGLAFLTRFDSVLFTAPLVLHVLWRSASLRNAGIAILAGAVLPLTWLLVSHGFYGDIFPTSYYAKPPQRSLPVLIGNAKYILSNLVFVGVIPVAALVLWLLGREGAVVAVGRAHIARYWWLYAGIGAQLAYGLTMATTHMMFSFRSFVPYIPAAAILLGDVMHAALTTGRTNRSGARIVLAAVALLVLFQAFQAVYTWRVSVNGLARVLRHVEYGSAGVHEYVAFIRTLRAQGEDIRRHWETLGERPDRAPQLFTWAGGAVPFEFRESYVYETLVSYRHCVAAEERIRAPNLWVHTAFDFRLAADYIHVVSPRHGPVSPQLPLPEEHYTLMSARESVFDSQPERFLVYWNPAPEPHRMPARIGDGCDARRATAGRVE